MHASVADSFIAKILAVKSLTILGGQEDVEYGGTAQSWVVVHSTVTGQRHILTSEADLFEYQHFVRSLGRPENVGVEQEKY